MVYFLKNRFKKFIFENVMQTFVIFKYLFKYQNIKYDKMCIKFN